MQEETLGTSGITIEILKRHIELEKKLASVQIQLNVLKRIYDKESKRGGLYIQLERLDEIFGFEPHGAGDVPVAKAAERGTKAGSKSAGKGKEDGKAGLSHSDRLMAVAMRRRAMAEEEAARDASAEDGGEEATPKDFDLISSLMKQGKTVDDVAEVTGFTRESVLRIVNNVPKERDLKNSFET